MMVSEFLKIVSWLLVKPQCLIYFYMFNTIDATCGSEGFGVLEGAFDRDGLSNASNVVLLRLVTLWPNIEH